MTNEKILELAVDAFGIHYDRLDARFTNFARAVLAAGASEGQADAVLKATATAAKEFAALRERIAGMEKDAERYRTAVSLSMIEPKDEAEIDAAIAKEPKQ